MAAPPARSRVDAAVYAGVAALALLAVAGPPVAAAFDPRLPVSAEYHARPAPPIGRAVVVVEPPRRDRWGSPWLASSDGQVWSMGPDRLDDEGGGDDVHVLPKDDDRLHVYRAWRSSLVGLAVVGVLLWELRRALRERTTAPRRPLGQEVRAAALLALAVAPLVGLTLALVSHLLPGAALRELAVGARAAMVAPLELALAGTVYLLTAAVLVGLRLRAARDP